MLNFHLRLSASRRKRLEEALKLAQQLGHVQRVKRMLAVLSLAEDQPLEAVAAVLQVCPEAVRGWVKAFLLKGLSGLIAQKSSGRPSKLTKAQKQELAQIIDAGPTQAGFTGACWRSPMIQHLIEEKYGVCYSVCYIAELLKSLGFSFQKARFVADHLDEQKRQEWLTQTWPQILRRAKQTGAYLLFGDEASFPQWGTLCHTWARQGSQPTVKTSGRRKSYKVFGLIDYFTGKFLSKCITGRLTSESYQEFLCEVLARTRKPLILIQDRAKYHTSVAMREFFAQHRERLTVYDLPSYSPDYNPIEKLWKKIKEGETHLHYFPTFESLMNRVDEAMVKFGNAPAEVLKLFGLYEKLAA